jgi:preprotein translocase subunit SecG
MKSRKFEKLLKIISIITIVLMILFMIIGWVYNKKIENAIKNENSEGGNTGGNVEEKNDDVFKK